MKLVCENCFFCNPDFDDEDKLSLKKSKCFRPETIEREFANKDFNTFSFNEGMYSCETNTEYNYKDNNYCYDGRYFIPKIKITNEMTKDRLVLEAKKLNERLVEIDKELLKL